jgi:L-serine dehydratase
MNRHYPSIFNDVIGPVMRGPSSSHSAASVRIGRLARDLMTGDIKEIDVRFDPLGSLATTHESQGSDMGLYGGFLGWEADDERLVNYKQEMKKAGIIVNIRIEDYHAPHPSTYKLSLKNNYETHEMTAISTGGGMIEVLEIDGFSVSIAGDFYETLIFTDDQHDTDALLRFLEESVTADYISRQEPGTGSKHRQLIEIKSRTLPNRDLIDDLIKTFHLPPANIKRLRPVLPVLSSRETAAPFINCEQMLAYNKTGNLDLWELGAYYESARGGISTGEVLERMTGIVRTMRQSIREGIDGKNADYNDRILGYQSGSFQKRMERQELLGSGLLNRVVLYTTAMMEVKSSMGVIVAAPTAGSCGTLPGACIGAADTMGLAEEDMAKAMLAAGMIGVFIAAHATFSAEVGGCQAECGAASGMAAAALVSLAKGNTQQAISAASMALQNTLGMVCDPVAKRVEVPCLGKNVMAASNALACANMALADFDAVIPLDEVINTMDTVGKSIPCQLRCTGLGGLSVTQTSKEIERRLIEQQP